ncbi:cyclic nucleotide-gated cation channel beta-3-like [Pollicipes pollicipes]|uniref:cyclic nucleotide-gated cation channel beta-3-like n=1 Tax=Pollicipes pollicipes TaxID=41117 RepID=UPI00188490DB|nr:cyclic nucleotide-gated cation channel beta-3-like [Pollicipes pollicipes]
MQPSIVVTEESSRMLSNVNAAFLMGPDDDWAVGGGMASPTFSLDEPPDTAASSEPTASAMGWSSGYMSSGQLLATEQADQTSLSVPHIRVTDRSASGAPAERAQGAVPDQIRHLVRRFTQRTNRVKSVLQESPTSSASGSGAGGEAGQRSMRVANQLTDGDEEAPTEAPRPSSCRLALSFCRTYFINRAINPRGVVYLVWLAIISIFFTYNSWAIPLRAAFPFHTPETSRYWYTFDYMGDLFYLLDIILFKSRVMFVKNGFWVKNPAEIRQHYTSQPIFFLDVISLAPIDIFYFSYGHQPLLRLNRLLKIQTYWKFMDRVDSLLAMPHYVRTIRTVVYMLLLIHVNACAYYAVSLWEGIGTNGWVFDGIGNPYVRCFYFATKTATSIGKNPKPTNEFEYVFMTGSWLMGVFVFALLVGQIRDIVAKITRTRDEFRQIMDSTVRYMQHLSLPPALQERVRLWMHYTWRQQKSLDELKALEVLPHKLQTDIALSVHSDTLKKVHLFQNCDEALLRDLVLKLKPINYLPGDYVCKKGEVGREMYIVKSGQVMVMAGKAVLATLQQGSVFGEISLLGLAGLSRRTADVRSRGFSTLFVLNKTDLQDAMKYYPDAQELLRKRAKALIKKNAAMAAENGEDGDGEEVIIKRRRPSTPKLLHAVLQVVEPSSMTASMLRQRGGGACSQMELRVPSSLSVGRYSPMSLPPGLAAAGSELQPQRSESLTEEDEVLVIDKSKLPPAQKTGRPVPPRFAANAPDTKVTISEKIRHRLPYTIGTRSLTSSSGDRSSRKLSRQAAVVTPDSESCADQTPVKSSLASAIDRGRSLPSAGAPSSARSAGWRHNRVVPESSIIHCSAMIHRERTPTSDARQQNGVADNDRF